MNRDQNDPYKKERNAAYAEHNRNAIRALPCFACIYAIVLRFDEPWAESGRDILVVLGMHLLVEICYGAIKRDSWVFTITVFTAWAWLIYEWWFVESVSFLSAFVPSVGLLLTATCLVVAYSYYKKIRHENT